MAAESAPPLAQAPPKLLGLRLSIMMFLQWAMFGLWVPVAGRFLRGPGDTRWIARQLNGTVDRAQRHAE